MITVMTIGGLDPSAGAGVLADIKTISAFGCYGVAAATGVTSQDTTAVFRVYNQTAEAVLEQLEPLLRDFKIAAIKTGMLPTREVVEAVADAISQSDCEHIVVDPVMSSTSGFRLTSDEAVDAMIRVLFPLASVVTPNAKEAERMTGIRVEDLEAMKRAAQALFNKGPKAVLLKGGDLGGETATDLLLDGLGCSTIEGQRIQSRNTHGTGCALASAIACLLARGFGLRDSVQKAKRYVAEAIRTAPDLGHGRGPLNHFPAGFEARGDPTQEDPTQE